MLRSFDPRILALYLSLAVGLVAACTETDESDTASPELRADASDMQTVTLTMVIPDGLGRERLQAVALAAEELAGGEAAHVTVRAEETDAGAMHLTLELSGPSLPGPEAIVAGLSAVEPGLADLDIHAEVRAGVPAEQPSVDPDLDETPEEIRARITRELRAKGVTGEITVDVVDEGEGRRVEVRVDEHAP